MESFFPDDTLNLFVIGVGSARTERLARHADHTLQIEDFGALNAALVTISDRLD